MTSNQPIVEPWKVRDFLTELDKQFKRRERLAGNFTTFRYVENTRRLQLDVIVSIRPHRGIKPIQLSVKIDEDTPFEEFTVQGNSYIFPIAIQSFEQYHREPGFTCAVLDAILHQLEEYGALGPVDRNG